MDETAEWVLVDRVRNQLPLDQLPEFVEWLAGYSPPVKHALLTCPPKSFGSLMPFWLSGTSDVRRELAWVTSVLRINSVLINSFVNYSSKFSRAVAIEDFKRAIDILDKIDADLGASYWAVEARLAVLQKLGGLQAQKVYLAEIAPPEAGSMARFLATSASERNEDLTNIGAFISRFSRSIESSDLEREIADYVLFKITDALPPTSERIAAVLRMEGSASLIDLYETTVAMLFGTLARTEDAKLRYHGVKALHNLSEIRDDRLDKLRLLFDPKSVEIAATMNTVEGESEELLLRGRYEEAFRVALGELHKDPINLHEIEQAARACAALGRSPTSLVPYSAARALAALYLATSKWSDAFQDVARLSINFRGARGFSGLLSLAFRMTFHGIAQENYYGRAIAMDLGRLRPEDLGLCVDSAIESLTGILDKKYVGNLRLQEEKSILKRSADSMTSPDSPALAVSISRRLVTVGKYSDAIRLISHLNDRMPLPLPLEADIVRAYALSELGRFADAFEIVAKSCVIEETRRTAFSLRRIFRNKTWEELKPAAGSLELAIALDLYLRDFEDDRQRSHLRYAFDDVLRINGLARPSQILEDGSQLSHPLCIYFLRKVCVPEVMDVSLAFRGSRDLDNERIRICVLLAEIDPENKAIYEEELFEVTKKIQIQEGLRQIDQSRVFVDTAAFSRWAGRELREQFDRYVALSAVGAQMAIGGSLTVAIRELLQRKAPLPQEFLEVPKDHGDELLLDLVVRAATGFFTDPSFGLGFFLSTRVRHGSFSGHIRGALEANQLIALRDELTDKYLPNESLLSEIPELTEQQRRAIHEAVSKFSQTVDLTINELTQEYLQIRNESKPKGVFAPKVSVITLHHLKSLVKDSAGSFDHFIAECLQSFWSSLLAPLEEVRHTLINRTKPYLVDRINELATRLQEILEPSQFAIVENRLNAGRTEIQAVVNRVAEWFSVPEGTSSDLYTLEQAIDIGIEFTKNACKGFTPHITRDIRGNVATDTQILGRITDSLFIALGNAYRHSGMGMAPKIELDVYYEKESQSLRIRVVNEVAPWVESVNKERVGALLKSLTEGELGERTTQEKGSGLVKLWSMTRPGVRDACFFGFVGPGKFVTELMLPVLGIDLGKARLENARTGD